MQPMGGPPMGAVGIPRQPIRQGTSHVVPVVVSAGLAVGVFCGLLFGLGTGKQAPAEPSRGSSVKRTDDSFVPDVPDSVATNPASTPQLVRRVGSSTGSAGAAAAGSGSNAGSAAGPGAGSSAVPEVASSKLTIEIEPDGAAPNAKIFVDDKPLTTGTTAEISFEPGVMEKTVKVVVQVPGYADKKRDVLVKSGEVTSLSIELTKVGRPTPSGGVGTTGGDGGSGGSGGSKSNSGTGGKSNGTGGGKSGKSGKSGKGGKSGLIDI